MRRIIAALSALLAFVIGFLCCIATIMGGALFIYNGLSYNQLHEWGLLSLDTSAFIEEDPEVSLLAMTPAKLVEEIMTLAAFDEEVTVNSLVVRYGLKLSEDQMKYIPDSVRRVNLQTLFTEEGLNYILDRTTLDYIFVYLPEDMLCTQARETISGKSLRQIVELNLTGLLSDIKIGYFLGVTYQTEDGVTSVVYADPEHPTLFELLAPLDLGHVIDKVVNSGDLVAAFTDDLGNVLLYQVAYALLASDNPTLSVMLADKTVNDLVVRGEDGSYSLAYGELLNGHYVGELLGYTAVRTEDGRIIGWNDADGAPVTGVQRGVSSILLEGVGEEDFDPMALVNGVYVGDLMGNTPVYDEAGEVVAWQNAEGAALGKLESKLAMKTIGDLTGGDFSVGSFLDGMYVGDLLGYYMEENDPTVWYQDEGKTDKVTGTNSVMARIDVGRLMNDDTYEVSDAFDGVLFGEMRGYTALYNDPEDPEKLTGWETSDGTPVTGTDRAIANIDLGKLLGDENYQVSDAFADVYLGEVLNYTAVMDGDTLVGWTKDDGTGNQVDVTGVSATFADYTLKALMDGEVDIQSEVDNMRLCDVLGLTSEEYPVYLDGSPVMIDDGEGGSVQMRKLVWKNGDEPASSVISALAECTVSQLSTAIDGLKIADVLGYTEVDGAWYSGTVRTDDPIPGRNYVLKAENGIIVQLCDLTIDELKSSDTVTGKIKGTKLSVVMGYEQIGDEWYDGEGNKVNGFMSKLADKTVSDLEGDALMDDLTIADVMNYHRETPDGDWLDKDGNKVNGIMGAIAGTPVSGLQAKINDVKIGEIMELTWNESAGEWQDASGNKASGVMAAFADLTVSEMSDADTVSDTVKNMTVGDALGYTLVGDVWMDGGTPVTGMMKAIAGSSLGSLQSDLDGVYLGEIMDYYEDGGIWYTAGGDPATGVMAAFAGLTVSDMKDPGAITNAIKTVKVGEAMGYYEDGGIWYSDAACTDPVTGILKAIVGTDIGELGGTIENLTIADALDYTKDTSDPSNPVWLDKNGDPAGGFLSLLDLGKPITTLPDEVNNAYNTATMEKLVEAGLIGLSDSQTGKLDQLDLLYNTTHPGANQNWRTMTINAFIGHIISSIGG